ncbi:predicted protein [Chaetoceros tenuissimus]|uniref:Sfi1 spindle body domain-containing protein n=1 Tax=Chaetoceros tenuissimus TaxID=426638 RepID=A0AAD3GZC4_9STRA|nr:predicted protein [Chaetoceros tenuissimus]
MYSTENELRKHIRQRRIANVFAILEMYRLENVYMKKKIQEAILFQEYVSLTKAFDSWRLFAKAVHSRKKTLKRILYLWQEFAKEERGKRLAIQIVHEVLSLQQKRVILSALYNLKRNEVNYHRLSKSFLGWSEFLYIQSCRMDAFLEERNLITQSNVFTSWQFEVLIQQSLKGKEKKLLQKVLLSWKRNIHDDIVKRCIVMRKVQEMIDEKDFKMLGLAFYYMRIYSIKRIEKRKVTSIAKRMRMKSTFIFWRRVTKQHVEAKQMLLKTIIFNRWYSFSEETREKREASVKAFMHWKIRIVTKVLRGWKNYANDKENRMKIALSLSRHLKSSQGEVTSYRSRDYRTMTQIPLQNSLREFRQPRPLMSNDRHAVHCIEAYRHSHHVDNRVGRSSHLPRFDIDTSNTPLKSFCNKYNMLDTTSIHQPSSSSRNQDPIIPSWVREALSKHESKRLDFKLRDEAKEDSNYDETKYCK